MRGCGDRVRELLRQANQEPSEDGAVGEVCRHHHRLERKLDVTLTALAFVGDAVEARGSEVKGLTAWVRQDIEAQRREFEAKLAAAEAALHKRLNDGQKVNGRQDELLAVLRTKVALWGAVGGMGGGGLIALGVYALQRALG